MKKPLVFLLVLLALLIAAPLAWANDTELHTETYYSISESWRYTLVHEVLLENTSNSYAFDITVRIPLNDTTDPAYSSLGEIELSPAPDYVETAADGKRYAIYQIDALPGRQSMLFTQRYALTVGAIYYNFDRAAVADAYSDSEWHRLYSSLVPEQNIESDHPDIVAFVQDTLAAAGLSEDPNPFRRARALFSAVNLLLHYEHDSSAQDALTTLSRQSGNCEGYTNLYIACLRAAGVAARQQSGYLYRPQEHISEAYVDTERGRVLLNDLRHTWVEYYLPELGWVVADPTFTYTFEMNGETQKFVNWTYFSMISNSQRYLYFRTGSTLVDTIDISALGGNVTVQFQASMETGHQTVPFSDIRGHWAAAAISYCTGQELFQGLSEYLFGPEEQMTRAMFVTVLGRYWEKAGYSLDSQLVAEEIFYDVPADTYYGGYLSWALEQQLIDGYGDGRFGPADNITREQMAKILQQFMALLGEDTSVSGSTTFQDNHLISYWADSGVRYCAQNGLISGHPDQTFRPADYATRAQVATILERIHSQAVLPSE